MPEAPEVHNVLCFLESSIKNAKIRSCKVTHPKLCANQDVSAFEHELEGEHFRAFHRLGKYLVFELDHHVLVAHMRMEGKFLVFENQAELDALDEQKDKKHIHACFTLEDGRVLCYRDTRKFGRMYLHKKEEEHPQGNWRSLPVFANVGKDALDPDLHASELYEKTKKRSVPLKNVLLDQSVIAGIGNIYADEILFEAGLSPFCKANHLDESDWQKILDATRRILNDASSCGGTTIRTFSYGNSHAGSYQDQLQIHGKEGECLRCHGEIVHTKVGQRGTWYCPQCQIEK
ncbi:DNA-formamidopyrimidine glycosylase [Allobaculum mucilyticum]|uniref:DNA-formamidopyrimidine glycosylase n=1 Tax=Allobaculum mucilyticum TaxID=2834459 RepID=UPI001E5A6A6D|nr:DNA-formamidopyrimidine glycosylase [Allobaculum mucilyticum]UNT95521.1 DNA-formamidopyrimidine glycosylase [Allobaculum mucilyticum]